MLASETAVVDFTATWCGPCRAIKTALRDAAESRGLTLIEVDVDAEANQALVAEFRVSAMPTIAFVKQGKELATLRVVGADMSTIQTHMDELKEMMEPLSTPSSQIAIPVASDASIQCQTQRCQRPTPNDAN